MTASEPTPANLPVADSHSIRDVSKYANLWSAGLSLFVILWLIPPVFIAGFIWRFSVDVPFWDDFVTGQTFYWGLFPHGLSWQVLISQHNESRPFFPRLLFQMLGLLSHWDLRYQMAASFVVILFTSLLMIRVCWKTIDNPVMALGAALLINFMLFSPVQWGNLLWGIQLITFIPLLALLIALLCISSPLKLWVSFPIAAIAAVVSTYSNSNGLLVWVLAAPFLFMHRSTRKVWALGLWFALSLIFIGYYFHNYGKMPYHPSMTLPFYSPLEALKFLIAFVGNGVRQTLDLKIDERLGIVATSIWGIGALYALIFGRKNELFRKALPWIIIGGYTLCSGVLTTLGRFGLGPTSAITERYPTFAIPLWFSIVPLWIVIFGQHISKKTRLETMSWFVSTAGGLVVAALMIRGCLYVRDEVFLNNARLLAGRAAAQFAIVAPDDDAIGTIYPGATFPKHVIDLLDRADYFHPQCFHTNDISAIAIEGKDATGGYFDGIAVVGDELWLNGWAYIPTHLILADAVLLTTPDSKNVERVFAVVVQDRGHRPDAADYMHLPILVRSGWNKAIAKDRLLHGAVVSAWAYDTYSRRAYRLQGSHLIP